MADQPTDLASKALQKLKLPDEVTSVLSQIQAEVADAYRQGFIEMVQAMREQASALNRIQSTLNILIQNLEPAAIKASGKLPAAFSIREDGEEADLAIAMVTADPIGAGYTLNQSDLAKAVGISQADVSILLRAFSLKSDGDCAVVVRKGKNHEVVNYHAKAVKRLLELIQAPPKGLSRPQQQALVRARKKLAATIR